MNCCLRWRRLQPAERTEQGLRSRSADFSVLGKGLTAENTSGLLSQLYASVPLDKRPVPLVQAVHFWFPEEALVDETLKASHTHESSDDDGEGRDCLPRRHTAGATAQLDPTSNRLVLIANFCR